MKDYSWLFVFLGALALILVACVTAPIQAPPAPRLDELPADSEFSAGEINLTGSGVPGSEVEAVVDGEIVGATQVGADGTWALAITVSEPGEHQVTVQTRYRVKAPYVATGDVIAEADPVTVNVARAVAVEMTEPTLQQPASGAELEAGALVVLSGGGTPGTDAQIVIDGEVVGVAPVREDGTWSLATNLTEAGEHEITVQTLDASGTVVAETEPVPVSLALETLAMKAPTLKLPAGGAELEAGDLELSGSGEPSSEVQVLVGGESMGVAQVDDDGVWSLEITLAEAGEYEITAQTLDASGEVVAESEPVAVSLALPLMAMKAPSLELPARGVELDAGTVELNGSGEPDSEVQVLVNGEAVGTTQANEDGTWSLQVAGIEAGEHEVTMQTLNGSGEVVAESEPVPLALAAPDEVEAVAEAMVLPVLELPAADAELKPGLIELIGSGEPDSAVQVLVDGRAVGTTQIDEGGIWSLEISLAEAGEHEIIVQALDASGGVIDEAEPVALLLTEPVVEAAVLPVLELPETGILEVGPMALSGSAQPNSGVQILANGRVVGLARADEEGAWSLEVTMNEAGDHEITVQTLNVGGDVIAEGEPVTLSLNATAETPAPASQAPASDASAMSGPGLLFPADGADIITGETIVGRLTLIGTGEPGTEVEILDGPVVLGTAQVNAEGEWLYTYEPPKGSHQYSVRPVIETTATDGEVAARVATPAEGINCNTNPGIDRETTYIVGTCDTLSAIGQAKGVSLDAVIAANPQFEDPDLIFPGDFVYLPE